MANDENKIILEFPATNVEIKFGETITFDNISGFLNSDRVTYNGESLTEEIAHLENDKADETYVDTELAKKADKTDTYTKSQVDNALNNKMNKANPTGTGRIAVGQGVVASGTNSQAFGTSSTASGLFSHAEGLLTTASGESSHAEGYLTTASGQSSHAEGYQTIASGRFQHVSGSYNVVDNNNTYVEIIGNGGNSYSRSNARTLDWSGNETLMGDLTFNGNKSLTSEISRLDGRIDNLPAPMIFKGTLGVGGTIQSLPTASASNEGFTYKVITDGTYAGQTAKVGDVFTSNGFEWVLIPAGDEDNDTWRAIKINGVEKLGNGISSGAVDFEDTANVKFEFDANGNKVRARLNGIYTESEVDDLLDDKADADNTYTKTETDNLLADKADKSDTYTKEEVDNEVYNVLPTDTASGSIAHFTDGGDNIPMKSLESEIVAVESGSGEKSPENPYTISGFDSGVITRCGVNLWGHNDVTISRDSYVINNEDVYLPAGTYIIQWKFSGTTGAKSGRIDDADGNQIATFGGAVSSGLNINTFTIPTGKTGVKFKLFSVAIGTYSDFEISSGSTTPDYTPYNGQTYTIAFGQTVYGGHFDNKGNLVVTHGYILLNGSENFTMGTASNFRYFEMSMDAPLNANTWETNIISNIFLMQGMGYPYCQINGTKRIRLVFSINDTSVTSVADLQALLTNTNAQIVYPLATPITLSITSQDIPTLLGENNIFSNCGDVEVEYHADIGLYIDKKISSLAQG